MANTFELEDIFNNNTSDNLRSPANFSIKEVHSLYFGRCYTINKLKGVVLFEADFSYSLQKEWDVLVYIHNLGDEFWLIQGDSFILKQL